MSKQSIYITNSGLKKKRLGVVLTINNYMEIKKISGASGMTIQDYIRQLIEIIIASK